MTRMNSRWGRTGMLVLALLVGSLALQSDAAVDPRGVTNDYATTAYAASGVIKSTGGRLYHVFGYNSKASAQFIQVFNSATVPADTAVPILVLTVAATSNFSLNLGELGRYFTTGIVWSNSSTGPTKTLGAADVWMNAVYK